MESIAQNDNYELSVDVAKNRVVVKIIGFWRSPDEVPNYVSDWEKTLSKVERGFTILADLREMKTHPSSVMPLHNAAMELTTKAGVGCSADVIKDDIAEMQMERLYRDYEANNLKFGSLEEAHEHLDNCKP